MNLKSGILLAGISSLLLLSGCHSSNGPVAATVNGIPISKDRVDMILKQRSAQGAPDTPEMRKDIIDHMALQVLVSDAAAKKGLDKKPEVAGQIDMAKTSILANAYVEDYIKSHPVSDEALHAEYEKYKGQMAGNEYKARHILVDKEADAKDIIAKLKKDPKVFAALAKEKSKDPGSKDNGGDLGWFDPRGMVPEFGAAVAKLEKGKFTEEPVKSQFGYHVILLEDSHPKQVSSFDDIKQNLSNQVQQQELKKLFDEMKASAKIEIMQPPATASAPTASAPAPAASAAAPAASANEAKPAEPAKK